MQPIMDEDFVAMHRRRSGVSDRDLRMAMAVVIELSSDMSTQQEPVRVSAQNGVVILAGTVSSQRAREAATAAARNAVQAREVCNALQVTDDAAGRPLADEFGQIVAAADLAGVAMPTLGRGRRRHLRLSDGVTLMAWLATPWLVAVVGIPVVPAVVAALAITAAALMTRL